MTIVFFLLVFLCILVYYSDLTAAMDDTVMLENQIWTVVASLKQSGGVEP
jgi:hypothetical protein